MDSDLIAKSSLHRTAAVLGGSSGRQVSCLSARESTGSTVLQLPQLGKVRLSRAVLAELHGMLDAAALERDVALGRVKLEVPEWLAKMYPQAKGLAWP